MFRLEQKISKILNSRKKISKFTFAKKFPQFTRCKISYEVKFRGRQTRKNINPLYQDNLSPIQICPPFLLVRFSLQTIFLHACNALQYHSLSPSNQPREIKSLRHLLGIEFFNYINESTSIETNNKW